MVISDIAVGLFINLLSDNAREILGDFYTPSLKAYNKAVEKLSKKYPQNDKEIKNFLQLKNVKAAIKEYLEHPESSDLLIILTDEFLTSFYKNIFLKERASSILNDFFDFLNTAIIEDPELRDRLTSHRVNQTYQIVQETNGSVNGIKDAVHEIEEVVHATEGALQVTIKVQTNTLEEVQKLRQEVKEIHIKNKDAKNFPDSTLEYARNIYKGFSEFKNLALYIDMRCTDDEKNVVLLDNYVEEWLIERKYPVLAILGDFGTGKTTYVTNLVKRLSSQYINNKNSYLPILVRLKDFTKLKTVEDIKDANVTNGLCKEDFDKKLENGKILFVFDGFDELPKDTKGNFNEIYSLTSKKNKVLITSRTHYFKNREEEKPDLNPDSMDYTGISLKDEYKVKTVYVNLFTEDDIKKYFEKKFSDSWEIKYKMMTRVYNLSDLSKRPILLDLIVQTLSEFSPTTGDITQGKLYDEYINLWMKRESKKRVDPKYVSILMEELAFKMFCENKYVITWKELSDIIHQKFSAEIMERRVNFEDLNEKIRTASFINRDSDDNFTFMHNSFMEFFVAKKLSEEINKGIMDCNSLGRIIITPEIIGFIKDMVNDKINLLKIIEYTKEKGDETRFLGGNAITLLKYLNHDFRKQNFSSMILSCADLSNCDLSDTCFKNSVLKNIKLSDSILKCADFSEADLSEAMLDTTSKFICFTWSPDSKYFATAGDDDIVRIWDASTYRQIKIFETPSTPTCLGWSKKYPILAIGNSNGSLYLWNVEDGELYARISFYSDSISSIALYGDRLIWGDMGGHIVCYDQKPFEEGRPILLEKAQQIKRNGNINKLVLVDSLGYIIVSSGDGLEILNCSNLSTVTLIGKNETPFCFNEIDTNVIYTEFEPKKIEYDFCNLYSREIPSLKVDKLHTWACSYESNYPFEYYIESDNYYKEIEGTYDIFKVIDICGKPHSAEYSLILYRNNGFSSIRHIHKNDKYCLIIMNKNKVVKKILLHDSFYSPLRESYSVSNLCYSTDGSKIAYIEAGEIKIIDADQAKDSFGELVKVIKRNINCEGIKIHNAKGLNDKQIKFLQENSKHITKT